MESAPSRERRPAWKTTKGMSDKAADAAALTYLLTYSIGRILEGPAQGDARTCGLVELHDIITTMVACAHSGNSTWRHDESTYLAIVICSDATVFHNASATPCEVFVDLWEDRRAHHHCQAWFSLWAVDGGVIHPVCKG